MTDRDAGARIEDGAIQLQVTSTGAPRAASAHGVSLLLHPATELEDGLAGLWLRVRAEGTGAHQPHALLGTASGGTTCRRQASPSGGDRLVRDGLVDGLRWSWSLSLLEGQVEGRAGWSWDVLVTNERSQPVEVDLVHAQDLALSPAAVLAANTLYPSQYLDLTPVDLGNRGTAVAVRQNMPGPTAPWALVACRTPATRWATDLLQLTGRGLPEGAPWPGLRRDLPATRLQHEHAAAVLQSDPVTLAPGTSWRSGFVVVALADHPEATSDADATVLEGARPGEALRHAGTDEGSEERGASLVGTGTAYLPARALTGAELDDLAGPRRNHPETVAGTVLSWFDDHGAHLVTAAKQAAVLRPHGQILRPLGELFPGEHDVTTTVWMDGSFCSHLTQGHAALGRSLSLRPSPLGLGRVHGLRVAVDLGQGWQLLGTPSLWRSALDSTTWWYAVDDHLLRVHADGPTADGRCRVAVETLQGEPVPSMVLLALDWSGAPGATGDVDVAGGALTVRVPAGALRGTADDARLEVRVDGCELEEVGDDAALFSDGTSRGEPVVTIRLGGARSWSVELRARTTGADGDGPPAEERGWSDVGRRVGVGTEAAGPAADLLGRLDAITGWYAHDALVHYLSPRGLEQHTGGAWGTRDVCQGPVGLLRAWGAHLQWRELLLMIFRAQHERGDWPQAFDFLPAHRVDVVDTAHGDVVYWPLLALGQYLVATADHGILDEDLPFTGDGSPGSTASLLDHVHRALDAVEATFVEGYALPAYGHGDWNDSLQPADPGLARRMVSTWTVVLQAEALRRLADGVGERHVETAARAQRLAASGVRDLRAHLLVDGVLSGYGVVGEDGVAPLIHPRDDRTGLHYSLLPMIHAVAGDLLSPEEARAHLAIVAEHLTGPDGARLFDRPVAYRGGPVEMFQRAEASTFFGREIGIMYVHAHLRYAEALARVGDGPGLLRALARAVPIGVTDLVPSAAPRQANAYSSSSDGAFADRYQASRDYDQLLAGEVALEAGWRVYSSGPGLFLEVLTQGMLGLRHAGDELELDPVLDPSLGSVSARLETSVGALRVEIRCGEAGFGPVSVTAGARPLSVRRLENPYRVGGVAVPISEVAAVAGTGEPVVIQLE
ncbi:GH36-type glycosyl hydrolase domain-containing protein [Ornithinimicrobium cerasi]|uniref:Cellobiose phosphorylase n=1 Tax=Ornithinimicrobium cerasi TaxID=2248773 RepID=A0A285VWJ2_9MICO|nr:cellobiose phosphorylase [Ornithinimicrobium cerasi]SOC57011.1 Cellobiose phosphorylase [Ornithinimicrobium cerasi]